MNRNTKTKADHVFTKCYDIRDARFFWIRVMHSEVLHVVANC